MHTGLQKNYRESYGMFACNGILFNHESPLRGETFVTRKITRAVAKIHLGLQDRLFVGNLDAERDWGHAQDYVKGMWLMMQHPQPDDFVLATGRKISVRNFIELAFKETGVQIEWNGNGVKEKGFDSKSGMCRIEVDPLYFRPAEVDLLIGNAEKAKRLLGWEAKCTVEELCRDMVQSDIIKFKRDKYLLDGGHQVVQPNE